MVSNDEQLLSRLAAVAALCPPLLALAQAARPDPVDARAPAPALRYPSAFADYKPWQEIKPGDWRAVNDTVAGASGGASGHAGHSVGSMKGMEMPAAPAPSASGSMLKKPAGGMPSHGGEHKHGGKP